MVQTLLLTIALVGVAGLLASATGSRWPMALLMAALLGRGVMSLDWRREIVRPYRMIRLTHLVIALVTLILPLVAYSLTADLPWLSWSLLTAIGQEGGNVAGAGLQVGVGFALPYVLLLLAAFPTLAVIEEQWFRRGTRGWVDGIWRSLLFGVVHMLVGVPLGVALFGLGAVGCVFTAVYLRAARRPVVGVTSLVFMPDRYGDASPAERQGMDASALQHLAYNVVALLLGVIALILGDFGLLGE